MAPPRRGPFTASGILSRFFGSAISNAAGYAIGGAVTPALEPLTQDLANVAWSTHPVKPLGAATAARLALLGVWTPEQGAGEAVLTGYSESRFDALVDSLGEAPPLGTLLELQRRKIIPAQTVDAGLARNGLLEVWRPRVRQLRFVLPSVTDMVRFAVREVYSPAQRQALDLDAEFPDSFAADAELIGIEPERARQYWASHWELPSFEQGVQMYFRGEITEAQLDGLTKALDYAPTWRAKLLAIARRIPPLDDMIRFAVREVYSPQLRQQLGLDTDYPAEFTPEAALHGMDEERARQYWAAHWRLPSALQGYRMLWRGEITDAELDGLLKALDYPPVWRERLANIAHLVPGRVDLRRMLKAKVIDRAEVLRGYQRLGYTAADAETLTRFAESEAAVQADGTNWPDRARARLFTVAHNEYLDGSIDQAKAGEMLALVGVPQADIATVVQLWDAEHSIDRLELTPAQIKKAHNNGQLTRDDAIAELVERTMTPEDAVIFLES